MKIRPVGAELFHADRLKNRHGEVIVQLPYLETCRVRNEEKTKEMGDAGCEISTCFVLRDVSEKYIGC